MHLSIFGTALLVSTMLKQIPVLSGIKDI